MENNDDGKKFINSFIGADNNSKSAKIFRKLLIISLFISVLVPDKKDLVVVGLTYASVSVATNEMVIDTVRDTAKMGMGLTSDMIKRAFVESGLYTKDELEKTIKEIRGELKDEKPVDKNG